METNGSLGSGTRREKNDPIAHDAAEQLLDRHANRGGELLREKGRPGDHLEAHDPQAADKRQPVLQGLRPAGRHRQVGAEPRKRRILWGAETVPHAAIS